MTTTNVINSVMVCNHTDSRIGNHSYAMWTEGDVYRITLKDGKNIWLSTSCYDHTTACRTDEPTEIRNPRACSYEDLPWAAKKVLFSILNPEGTEEEKTIFLYGEEEGKKRNADRAWAKANAVYSEGVTLSLMKQIGRWDKVLSQRSVTRQRGTGYRDYFYRLKVGKKVFEVGISANNYSFGEFQDCIDYVKEIDIVAEKAANREYYNKVKSLADEAGVPWHIAALLKNKDGDRKTNIAALAEARLIHFAELSDESIHCLVCCGIDRRCAEICNQLIRYSDLFDINGQVKSRRFANYLADDQGCYC